MLSDSNIFCLELTNVVFFRDHLCAFISVSCEYPSSGWLPKIGQTFRPLGWLCNSAVWNMKRRQISIQPLFRPGNIFSLHLLRFPCWQAMHHQRPIRVASQPFWCSAHRLQLATVRREETADEVRLVRRRGSRLRLRTQFRTVRPCLKQHTR